MVRMMDGARRKNDLSDITNERIKEVIDSYIHNQRDREILKRRFIDGVCFEPLAEEFDLSTIQVKRIVYKHSKIIDRHL